MPCSPGRRPGRRCFGSAGRFPDSAHSTTQRAGRGRGANARTHAAALIATGADRPAAGPKLLATRSRTYPDTEEVLGWNIGTDGFRIVLSVEIATVVEKYMGEDVRNFLGDYGLTTEDISTWVLHAAGPKVIDAVENVLDLPADALDLTRKSLRDNGNLSSVSVLDILQDTMTDPPPPGSIGLMIAMGPGFSAELVLLGW